MKMVSFMLPSLSNAASSLCAHPDAGSLRRPYHNSWALPYVSNRKTAGQNSCSLPNIVLFSICNLIKCCFQFLHASYPDAFKTAILSIDSVQPFHACTSGRFPACKVRVWSSTRMSIFPSFRCSMVSTNSALFFP